LKTFTRNEKRKKPEMIEYYDQCIKEGDKPQKAERKAREKYGIPKGVN